MLDKISLFKTADAMARHAGARQAVISENIAHADTPRYRAKDLPEFSIRTQEERGNPGMIATRASHLSGAASEATLASVEARHRSENPNENTVQLQEELLFAVEAKRQHDRALAIYKSGLRILRTSISGK